jgi:hypothetical protein
MVKSIRFTPETEDDSYQGYAWYESRRIGLGREFISVQIEPSEQGHHFGT